MKVPRHPFRFGVINELALPPQEWLSHVRQIEEYGFDTFLIRDHFVADFFGEQYAPLTAMMAAAMATMRLRVGSMVIDNDYRHPIVLAKEIATIDALSGGRVELGLGAGWLQREYELLGIPFDANGVRVSRLEEAIKIIKGVFELPPFSFSGQHYNVRDLSIFPQTQRRPRLFVGGGNPRMLRIAGREADSVGLLTTSVRTGTVVGSWSERSPEAVMQKITWVAEGAGERLADIELSMIPTLILSGNRFASAQNLIAERAWDGTPEQILEAPSVLIGTPSEIADQLIAHRARYGLSYIIASDTQLQSWLPVMRRLSNQ